MKIVKIKMIRDFPICDNTGYREWTLEKGKEYFAIDGGDFWAIQGSQGHSFCWIIPKVVKPSNITGNTAEVIE